MPAALDVNWGEIRMLAITYGVREAARRMGISEESAMQRSAREGWLRDLPRSTPLPATVLRPVSGVSTGAKALVNAMADDSKEARATVLRVARRAVSRVEKCDDDELMVPEVATVLNQHTKTLALAGGWASQAPTAKINLSVTGGNVSVSQSQDAPAMDAEWCDAGATETGESVSTDVDDY